MSDSLRGIRENTGMRLMALSGSFCILLSIASVVYMWLGSSDFMSERHALLLSSAVQCVLAFCVPAFICGAFASKHPCRWLGLSNPINLKQIAGVAILFILALPAINQIISWNTSITFPQWASGIESELRRLEEAASESTAKILSFSGIGGMLATVGVVGVLTGFSEELFFRGALQKVLMQSRLRTWMSVWSVAFIFSAVHFQFFGFIPRLLLGAMFGYLYVWSRSIWLPVFAHALNNSLVVIVEGVDEALGISPNQLGGESGGIDSLGTAGSGEVPWAAIASGVATAIFLFRFRHYFFSPEKGTESEEDQII